MKRMAFESMVGMTRWICRIVAVLPESAGVNVPRSRNCLIFDMRRRDEAEGERSMMGSRRRAEGFLRFETRAEFVVIGVGAAAWRERLRPR